MFYQAALLAPFLLPALHPVSAQTSNATCSAAFDWSSNSLDQSPCVMAAYLRAACRGNHQINALPPGFSYNGPPTRESSEPCWCSSVTYSMYQACQLCQGVTQNTRNWGQWTTNCTSEDTFNGSYPEEMPSGTAIPAWAFVPFQNNQTFSSVEAQNFKAENSTEFTRTSGPSGSPSGSSPSGTGPSGADPTPTNDDDGGGSNAGAIAGGVVGGVVGLALIAGLAWFFLRRRRNHAAPVSPPQAQSQQPLMYEPKEPYHPTFTPQPPPSQHAGKLYNPADPSTFPSSPMAPTPAPTYHSHADEIRPNRLGAPSGHPHLPEV